MKKRVFYFGILVLLFSCKGTQTYTNTTNIAVLKKNHFSFLIDTLKFKKKISQILFSENNNVKYDKVEIKKKILLKGERMYFTLLTCNSKRLKSD